MLKTEAVQIDWADLPIYNTIMAVAAGVGLILIVDLGRRLILTKQRTATDGYAVTFAALGFILTATGLHMTLTWPLAPGGFAFDNIIFGEPALAFGVTLLAAGAVLWSRGDYFATPETAALPLSRLMLPMSVFGFGMGLACFGIAAAGWRYTLFAAPPQEPISGQFADLPLLEATFISGLYVLVGLGCVVLPFALWRLSRAALSVVGVAWGLSGLAFLLFGALNYFTHIGLIINTS